MRMPSRFDDDLHGVERAHYPDGTPHKVVCYSVIYPPIGFFPIAEIGNGDYYGYYWPIGMEEEPPLIAFSSHDAYALIPEYSGLLAAARSQLAASANGELEWGFRAALEAVQTPIDQIDRTRKPDVADHRGWLEIDQHSPFRHCAVGDMEMQVENFDQAELHYRAAIEVVPSYTAAHFALGYLYRRTRRVQEATLHLRSALISPLAFWGGNFWAEHHLPGTFRNDWSRKALLWLNQIKQLPPSLASDPFMLSLSRLKLTSGEAANDDVPLLSQLVDDYAKRTQWTDAINLWINIGDRAAFETTSFRERHSFTPRSFAVRLADLFHRSGNARRAELVESVLQAMHKPDGLHL